MRVIPYEPWHYELLSFVTYPNLPENTRKLFAQMYADRGDAYSIEDQGRVIACLGVMQMWPGVAEAWTVLSSEAVAAPVFLHSRTKTYLEDILRDRKYHRVQAIVRLDQPEAVRWIERLGFRLESKMEQFTSDRADSGMFVRLAEEVTDGT